LGFWGKAPKLESLGNETDIQKLFWHHLTDWFNLLISSFTKLNDISPGNIHQSPFLVDKPKPNL